ncbi:MAG: flagellar basal body L-ring protein FlgH [Candidatus Sumerlaeia bacterium]
MKWNTMKYVAMSALVLAAGLCTACLNVQGTRNSRNMEYENPPVVAARETTQANPYQENDGSLFQPASGRWSVWGDVVASEVGDILTVRVLVQQTATHSATTDLGRQSNVQAGIGALFGLEKDFPGVDSKDPLVATTAEELVNSSYSNDFSGQGTSARSGRITADISAVVTHVYPNGNMEIQGSRSMQVNEEDSLLTVKGMVRPQDIAYDNIVLSNRIARARIEVTGRGVISDKQRPGFLSRTLDWLWPL